MVHYHFFFYINFRDKILKTFSPMTRGITFDHGQDLIDIDGSLTSHESGQNRFLKSDFHLQRPSTVRESARGTRDNSWAVYSGGGVAHGYDGLT